MLSTVYARLVVRKVLLTFALSIPRGVWPVFAWPIRGVFRQRWRLVKYTNLQNLCSNLAQFCRCYWKNILEAGSIPFASFHCCYAFLPHRLPLGSLHPVRNPGQKALPWLKGLWWKWVIQRVEENSLMKQWHFPGLSSSMPNKLKWI